MISLFPRSKVTDAFVLRVPSYCVPCEEAPTLRPKRESQLEWMREQGVAYLGNPAERVQRQQPGPAGRASARAAVTPSGHSAAA